ncbi:MAG: hypothetical protein L0229_20200 [Blastocatellia bacterium]|nr:hypothetical protein [Blastocatellia bacterium]
MGRTVPASITALIGQKNLRAPVWLLKWELDTGTKFYSSGEQVTYAGNVYEANRIVSIPSFEAGLVDRKRRDFSKLTIQLDDLPDVGGSFPFVALDALEVFEDKRITIYCYSPDALDAVLFWWGYSGRPTFNNDYTVDLTASFFWDAIDIPIPRKNIQQAGFRTLRKKRQQDEEAEALPIVYGAGNFFIRPVIYRAQEENGYLNVNFIISSTTAGGAFDAGDIVASKMKLFNITPATAIEVHLGGAVDTVPPNLGRFPLDTEAHNFVAYGYATFPITDEIKDRLDELEADDIRMEIGNGRKLLDTSQPSANPVLILKDLLRDPNNSLGLASGDFDAAAVSSAASYAGARYSTRYEIPGRTEEQRPLIETVQSILGDFHGFITFDNGLVQISVKRNTGESAAAVFATIDSGIGGRTIHNDDVKVWERDSSEISNQATIQYFTQGRKKRTVRLVDTAAQTRAGGTLVKVVDDERVSLGLTDETQAAINGAITVREELNGNLFCEFAVPIFDAIDISPGQVIEVRSPRIFNNASNKDWRVIKQSIETGDEPLIRMTCQVYKAAFYNDDTAGLGVDLLRGDEDTSAQGRPPDVTPDSLIVVDTGTNDTEGRLATIQATCTFPAVDLASEQAEGTFRQLPWAGVQLWWHYTDEPLHKARLGLEIKYSGNGNALQVAGDFQVDWHKNRSIQCHFVAIGHNRSRAPLGYIPDPTKASHLTANLSATGATASVAVTTAFAVDDFVFIEREIDKVLSKTASSITFVNAAGVRTAQFDTEAIAHPSGTEIAVAKLSYPSLIIPLTAPRFTYPVVTGVVARQRGDGVRFKWSDVNADNQEKYYLYWSTDADAGSNAAKLGVNNPTWYLTDPNGPPAGVNLVKVDGLAHKVLQEDIGAAGTTIRARVAARNGKRNFSSTLSSLVSNILGDDAVPTVSTAPKVQAKKQGIKVRAILPTTNMKTFGESGKVEHVIRAKDGGGSTLGYLSDNTSGVFVSSGPEFRFDQGKSPGHFYNFNREAALALWATVATLEIWVIVWNAVGQSAASPITTITVSTWEVSDVPQDTAAPTLASPSAPTVQEFFGKLDITCPLPTANINTLEQCQVVMSESSTAPAGNPTVGSEGVVKIKFGQHVTFKPKQRQTANLWFFYRWKNAVNYSVWSSSGNILAADINRPVKDVIGDGPPALPMGFVRSATSGTGHTSTTFVMDGSASAVDDFYNGMVLHVLSLAASSRVREITDYNGATRTATVSPAFDSTPVGALAFEVHFGQARANKSGTGHTATTFVLDSGASGTNDFYSGMSIYIPSEGASDGIQKITDYVGSTKTCTVSPGFASTPSGSHGYVIWNGSIGNNVLDQSGGVFTGVAFRQWRDDETGADILEFVAPTGENGYSLQYAQVQIAKKGNGKVKVDTKVPLSIQSEYRYVPPVDGFVPVARILFANLYREGGSDGKSAWSYWVEMPNNPSVGGVDNFDPSLFPPFEVDFLDDDNLPGSEYPTY